MIIIQFISLQYADSTFFYHHFSYKLQHGAWRYSRDHLCVQMNAPMCMYVCTRVLTESMSFTSDACTEHSGLDAI